MRRTRNERKRSRENIFLSVSVVLWALILVFVLVTNAKELEEAQETETEMEPEEAVAIQTFATEQEENPLEKLPMIENATLTHYCICEECCGKKQEHPSYGITDSGRAAEPYVSVAVDPHLIELGSTVFVDYGDGEIYEYRADDTGSGVAGAHIDLCVEGHQEALDLGTKTVRVWWSK